MEAIGGIHFKADGRGQTRGLQHGRGLYEDEPDGTSHRAWLSSERRIGRVTPWLLRLLLFPGIFGAVTVLTH